MRLVEGWADIEAVDEFLGAAVERGDKYGATVQAFDARYIAGGDHLATAVDQADRAFDRGDAIADDRAIEILCYAAGRRQIERAMEIGVEPGHVPVVIVVDGGDGAAAAAELRELVDPADVLGHERDEGLIREYFHITERERRVTEASLEALVIERVSLLTVDK